MCRLEKVFNVQETVLLEEKASSVIHCASAFPISADCILETLWFPVECLTLLCGRIQLFFEKKCGDALSEAALSDWRRFNVKHHAEFAEIACVSFFNA